MSEPRDFLPLSRSMLHLLLALREGDRHGYAVKKRVEELSKGVVRMGPGTLYATIQRGEEQKFIAETDQRAPLGEDQSQRRYYSLTALGTQVLVAEVERIGSLMDHARSVISGGTGG